MGKTVDLAPVMGSRRFDTFTTYHKIMKYYLKLESGAYKWIGVANSLNEHPHYYLVYSVHAKKWFKEPPTLLPWDKTINEYINTDMSYDNKRVYTEEEFLKEYFDILLSI